MKKITTKIYLIISFNLCLFLQHASTLLTVPTEDLLGPEVCPAGSFCIETSYCTSTYYSTRYGLPFYCGPHEKIDSKVCCIETEAATTTKPHIDLHHDELELNKISNGLPTSNLSHFNSTDDDDEVEILSLPFATNHGEEIPFDSESILSEPDAGLERTLGDLEALLEDAIEQEFNSAQASPSQNVRETGFKPVDAQQNVQHDFEHSNRVDEPTDTEILDALRRVESQARRTEAHINPDYERNENIELRTHASVEDQKHPRAFTCPCEKGEKGDPGIPGEPGKIIYIPVFVNTAGVPLGATYGTTPTGAPIQFAPSQASLNQPLHGQIPQHSNPTVVPFNVPINIPTPQPQQHSLHSPQQTFQQQQQVSISQVQQHQQPPSLHPPPINSLPYTDDMQARLSRHAQQVQQDQRFSNRRY